MPRKTALMESVWFERENVEALSWLGWSAGVDFGKWFARKDSYLTSKSKHQVSEGGF